jgi:hypothetical protein
MKLQHPARQAALEGLAIAVLALPSVAGCGSDDDSTTTLAPATTEATSSTEPSADPASNIESLSYLMQGLLTTPQIGGGWVDMGRVIVPASREPTTGPLCPDGRAIAEPIGTTLNAQVHTTFQRTDGTRTTAPADTSGSAVNPAFAGGMVMETLLWNERLQVDEAFAAMAAATGACIGTEWTDPDMGNIVMTSFDAPTLGTDSFTSGYTPVAPPTSDPWAQIQGISILMSDPSSPVSIVISVSMTVVHNNPDQQVAALDTDELIRIAEAAVARIVDGL